MQNTNKKAVTIILSVMNYFWVINFLYLALYLRKIILVKLQVSSKCESLSLRIELKTKFHKS